VTYAYAFDESPPLAVSELSALLGGKGAGLATMAARLGLPVPPGFTITTAACRAFLADGWPAGLDGELEVHMRGLEEVVGRRFGDAADPLLVSVRSGAPVSMPGMMDTILNLGLNDETAAGLAAVSGDAAFAADCHARFTDMFTRIVGVGSVPHDPWAQLRAAIEAVFRSWNGERARAYRAREGIPDDLCTAVTVQAMVFGNRGPESATGVLFTRDPATGEAKSYGDVLFGAQGEDVVAGTHQTEPIAVLDERLPAVAGELRAIASALERHHADLCDIEFTIEEGKLWILQVRVGKRSPQAALRIAMDMAEAPEFPLSREAAVRRVMGHLADPPKVWSAIDDRPAPLATGLPASPGVAAGEIVTTSVAAISVAKAGRAAILVRPETSPEDVPGMAHAAGILTSRGGLTSHAAVVARGWGIPAVVGAADVEVGERKVVIAGRTLAAGETITIDGGSGEVFGGTLDGRSAPAPEAVTLLAWAEELGIAIERGGATEERVVGMETGARPEAAGAAPDTDDGASGDDVVRALAIKGLVAPDSLAPALRCSPERLAGLLEALLAEGHVEDADGAVRLTQRGAGRAAELMAADRERWGSANADAALDAFVALDGRMKEIVTAWQLKSTTGEPVLNDHTDAAYDAAVLERLGGLHHDAAGWLDSVAPGPPRLGVYRDRLADALQNARAGDGRYIASPHVDSYHGIWFELHEDLIRLAGRERAAEVAAGRA
jgi:pyruvate,orthophosphate dikinase